MHLLFGSFFSFASLLSLFGCTDQPAQTPIPEGMRFYDLEINSLNGEPMSFQSLEGKYVLCVNVASRCGYTPQYKGLQELYTQYGDRLVVVGFPCNQFMGQEPGTAGEIQSFCEVNYGVSFPLTEKIDVKGKDQHPVYQWLCSQELNGETEHKVKWNFHKFLVSPEGQLIGSFPSGVDPMGAEITGLIR